MPVRLDSISEIEKPIRLSDISEQSDIDNQFEQIDESWKLSEDFKIPVENTMSLVAGPEPSAFGKVLHSIKQSIRERTGYFEPRLEGKPLRGEQPIRTGLKLGAYYTAATVSGLSGTALDVLANKTKGDLTLADSVARITGFEPTSKEQGGEKLAKYIGLFTPAGALVRTGTKSIPASKVLKTILDSGLTFTTVESAIQFSENITQGKPVDWSRIHYAGGVGVLWGTGEVVVEAAMTGLIKQMDKYWGEKGMEVAEKLRPEGMSREAQYARQQAEIKADIKAYKSAKTNTPEGQAVRQAIRDKYHGTNVPKNSAFSKPEVTKPAGQAITKPKAQPPAVSKPQTGVEATIPTITKMPEIAPQATQGKVSAKEGVSKYKQTKLLKETAEEIKKSWAYTGQEEAGKAYGGDRLGPISKEMVYINPKYKGEIESYFGERGKRGSLNSLWNKITFDKTKSVSSWDQAALERGMEDASIDDYLQAMVTDYKMLGDTRKRVPDVVLDTLRRSSEWQDIALATKYDMLQSGQYTEQQITDALEELRIESEANNLDDIEGIDYDNETIETLSEKSKATEDALAEERRAIQTEGEAAEVGDFLEGLEGKTKQKDLLGRPILEGGATGQQQEIFEKEKYKLAEPDIEGQQVFPTEPRLPGGRQAGGTPIFTDALTEIAALTKKAYKNPVQMTKDLTEIIKRNTKAGVTHIKTLGTVGESIAKDIDGNDQSIVYQATKKTNTDEVDTRNIFKGLKKENRELIAKIINGRVPREGQPEWAVKRADQLRSVLDRAMNEATELGMQRKVEGKKILVGGSGKAFPQVPNDDGMAFLEEAHSKGMASAKVFSWAQEQVSLGRYDNIDRAIKALQIYRDSLIRGLNPYLEMSRVELPIDMIEWDGSAVLPGLYSRNWMTIEGVRKWGNDFEKLDTRIEKIRIEYGSHEVKRVKTFIELNFGKMSDASKEAQKICNMIRAYQFQTKVGLSPLTILRNMFDRIAKGFAISPSSTIRTFAEYPPFINQFIESSQKLEEEMIKIGAVFGHGSISEGYEAGRVLTELTSSPFTASERGNQVTIALVQMHKFYNDIQRLQSKDKILGHLYDKVSYIWGGGTEQIRARIKATSSEDILKKIESGEELTQDEIGYVLHTAVKNNAFPMIMSTKPLWYDNHPVMKAIAQFKTWPVRQLNLVWNDVVKYTWKTKDPSRLLGFLAGVTIAGELYNIIRDFLFDKRESLLSQFFKDEEERDYLMAVLNDMVDGGVVGMLADFTYGVKDWVTGVSIRTGHNVWDTGNYMVKSPRLIPQAFEHLLEQEVTPYRQIKKQVDKIDRALINENNITKDYTRWRAEGWDWFNNKKNPTLYKKIKAYTDDVINGKVDYKIGEDTLAYELASRQIIVGDINDATDYIEYIINNSDKPVKESISNIKRSMKNRAPLGKIAEKDRDEFFKSYSPEEKARALEIHNMYISNYEEALSRARISTGNNFGYEPL